MDAVIGFIVLPFVAFTFFPLWVLRVIGLAIVLPHKLRWSAVIGITIFELAATFYLTSLLRQSFWNKSIIVDPTSPVFWEVFQASILLYMFFYLTSIFTFRELFKEPVSK